MLRDSGRPGVDDLFALLADKHPAYEHRRQQQELAYRIHQAFTRKQTGVFEAGTGTGKSLAALIPAALSGKKVVISSATIALQEQYIRKDIPLLQSILPFTVNAQVLKGRANYLGLRRWQDFLLNEEPDARLVDWVGDTAAGDISELDFLPPFELWSEIDSDSDDCLRNKCPEFNRCFYFEAKRAAEKADILVVNHALLLSDAVSRGNILPQYDLLIVDEAQHLPAVARDVFSAAVSAKGLHTLAGRALKKVLAPPSIVRDLETSADYFMSRLNLLVEPGKTRLKEPLPEAEPLRLCLEALKTWLDEQQFEHILDVELEREKARLKAKALSANASVYISCLEKVAEPSNDWVVWSEKGDSSQFRLAVAASPLDVSAHLKELLFDKPGLESSIWMSATLATGGQDPFSYFKREIGAPDDSISGQVSSPFDYKRQALLYLPDHLCEPNCEDYTWESSREIEKLVRLSCGRAFVLFTSYKAMNRSFELLADVLPFACKKQGDLPRNRLIEWFTGQAAAVLFGTSSFWEGVSIDGEKLSCVIIDRIPFQAPDDPIYEARCQAIQASGSGDWFADLALPHAITRLKQGVGRLIRTRSDRGLVAILDPRIRRKYYGRLIRECLPPMHVISSLAGMVSLEDKLDSIA